MKIQAPLAIALGSVLMVEALGFTPFPTIGYGGRKIKWPPQTTPPSPANGSGEVGAMAYSILQSNYNSSNFFDQFDFFTDADPTHGHVRYIDRGSAEAQGMIRQDNGSVYIGTDTQNQAPYGRQSVRIVSKELYTRGLFVLDLSHMPVGCGTWPAFWTVGDNWPNNGEIDIVEGVNNQNYNSMTLHTSAGCSTNWNSCQTGTTQTGNCYVNDPKQASNQGCQTLDYRPNTYGTGFNNNGGGVVAMEWNGDFIKVWMFRRGEVPSNVCSDFPEPALWAVPAANFQGNCDINQRFSGHRIVFNLTFCGDWAGSVWGSSGCNSSAPTCNDFVSNNPGAFHEAYWRINSLKVWNQRVSRVRRGGRMY